MNSFACYSTTRVIYYDTQVCSNGLKFPPTLQIGEKTHLGYSEISPNRALNHRHVAVFLSFLGNWSTHLTQSIFMYKCSCNISPVYIFKISAIYLTFSLRSLKIMWGIFLEFSGVEAPIGRPESGSSLVLVRPHLNSLNHQQRVACYESDVPYSFTIHFWVPTVFIVTKKE